MKRSMFITTLTIVMLLGALEVQAQWGWGRGVGGMGPGYCYNFSGLNLSQNQIKNLGDLRQSFWNDINASMAKLEQKQLALDTLMQEADPDAKKAASLQQAISDLQAQLAAKRLSYQLETQKALTPDQRTQLPYGSNYWFDNRADGWGSGPGYGCYMNPGYGGRGPGHGRGCRW